MGQHLPRGLGVLYFQYRLVLTEAEQGCEGGKEGSHADAQMQHILGTGNSQCKGPVAGMTETNDKDARGLARVNRGELTEEERSGGHQAHIRSHLEGLCLLHQGNGNYWRVRINEGRNQGR